MHEAVNHPPRGGSRIAVVGLAGRFPRADGVDEFWRNLRQGVDTITDFGLADAELVAGDPERDEFVASRGLLEGPELFDAALFGISPREAELTDPQHRIFLECALEALEHAACDPARFPGRIGVFGGSSASTYLMYNLMANPQTLASTDVLRLRMGNSPDFLTSRVSYLLGLRGPSMVVQTACSTSLAAVHAACQSLLAGECEVALAGGVSVATPQKVAMKYEPGSVVAPDGRCRAFDAAAEGSVAGEGVGIVVLKRLDQALADRDTIHAVVLGTCLANDGDRKGNFTAPSVEGLAEVIAGALEQAGVGADTIQYVEAHGSGTRLGDSVEVAALERVFARAGSPLGKPCLLGSVKTNIGHLDAAAGIAAFIKTVLALRHRQIPPTLHFRRAHPRTGLQDSRFRVVDRWTPWEAGETPRRAGVTSLGIGGTNVHVVLEEAPDATPAEGKESWRIYPLSAATPAALERLTDSVAEHFDGLSERSAGNAARTLARGRAQRTFRRVAVCRGIHDAARALQERDAGATWAGVASEEPRPIAFMFPGVGDQYPGMGRGLYHDLPVFRETLDLCCGIVAAHAGVDLHPYFTPADAPPEVEERPAPRLQMWKPAGDARRDVTRTLHAHAAVFALEYSLARQWIAWGIAPSALIGHSVGEFAAACVAGVFSLENALRLVCERARLIEGLPQGRMIAVPLPEGELAPMLEDMVSLAAVNAPAHCVVAGTAPCIERLEAELAARRIVSVPLPTEHAFHSSMMAPVREPLLQLLRSIPMSSPRVPLVSSADGQWLSGADACDPDYWAGQLCRTVRFADGVRTLVQDPTRILLEVGPGQTLCTAAWQQMRRDGNPAPVALASLRSARDPYPDACFLLESLGRLWTVGAAVDWDAVFAGEELRSIPLPTYPFERARHWVERAAAPAAPFAPSPPAARAEIPDPWVPSPEEEPLGAGVDPEGVEPGAQLRQHVATAWSGVLGVQQIDPEHNFFTIGGNSLLAMQVASRLREAFEVELPISMLFENPTLAGTAAALEVLLLDAIDADLDRGSGTGAPEHASEAPPEEPIAHA